MYVFVPTFVVVCLFGEDSDFIQLIVSLALIPFFWAFWVMFLDVARTGNRCSVGFLFSGFNDYMRISGTLILQNVYIFLWTLLLIIPGIIKSLSYAMTPYILKDHPELSYDKAITRSSAMMKGHKMELFWLYLNFIGWIILSIVTLGIALLWVCPYLHTALAHFYLDLKEEYEDGPTPVVQHNDDWLTGETRRPSTIFSAYAICRIRILFPISAKRQMTKRTDVIRYNGPDRW